jgi:hypothetical protein
MTNRTPFELQQRVQFFQRRMRACEIMNAVARRDQVEALGRVQIVRRSGKEADAVRQACRGRGVSSLLDRLFVRIEPRHVGFGEFLGDGHADAARTAAHVENASALLQAGSYARHRPEPVARKAVLVLAAVDQVEGRDAVLAHVGEPHAAAFLERIGHLRRQAQQTGARQKSPPMK